MKVCCTCKVDKPLDDYYNNKSKSDGKSYQCRECKSGYNKSWYTRNKKKHKADVVQNNNKYKYAARSIVNKIKENPCMDCNIVFPEECMDFDHVKGKKYANISTIVNGKRTVSLAVLHKELLKCELVCSNCHRMRTKARRLCGETDITENS